MLESNNILILKMLLEFYVHSVGTFVYLNFLFYFAPKKLVMGNWQPDHTEKWRRTGVKNFVCKVCMFKFTL